MQDPAAQRLPLQGSQCVSAAGSSQQYHLKTSLSAGFLCDSDTPGTPLPTHTGVRVPLRRRGTFPKRQHHALALGVKGSQLSPRVQSRQCAATHPFEALLAVAQACQAAEALSRAQQRVMHGNSGGAAAQLLPVQPADTILPCTPVLCGPCGSNMQRQLAGSTWPQPGTHASQLAPAARPSAERPSPSPLAAVIARRVARVLSTLPSEEARRLAEARAFLATF